MYTNPHNSNWRKRPNLIDGAPLEFGNQDQIQANIEHNRIMSGELGFAEGLEWSPCSWNFMSGWLYPVDWLEADTIKAYLECPRCKRLMRFESSYEPVPLHCQSLIEADSAHEEFECWNCGLEFEQDEGSIFVSNGKD